MSRFPEHDTACSYRRTKHYEDPMRCDCGLDDLLQARRLLHECVTAVDDGAVPGTIVGGIIERARPYAKAVGQ